MREKIFFAYFDFNEYFTFINVIFKRLCHDKIYQSAIETSAYAYSVQSLINYLSGYINGSFKENGVEREQIHFINLTK